MSTETLGMICGARHSRRRLSLACRCSRLAIRICQVTGLRGTHSLSDSPHVLTASCLVLRRIEAGPELGVDVPPAEGLVIVVAGQVVAVMKDEHIVLFDETVGCLGHLLQPGVDAGVARS